MDRDALTALLRRANPWWQAGERLAWVDDDPDLTERARHPVDHPDAPTGGLLADVARTRRPGDVTLVVGPRCSGKTTAVKDLVRRVLSEPGSALGGVVLVPVEADVPGQGRPDLPRSDLRRILTAPQMYGVPPGDGSRLWVVDELTSVDAWSLLLREVSPVLRADELVATGSVQEDTPWAMQFFLTDHGRRAGAVHRVGPLTLAETLLASPGRPTRTLRTEFLQHGGFPRAIAEYRDTGAVSAALVERLHAGIRHDVDPADTGEEVHRLLVALSCLGGYPHDPAEIAHRIGYSPSGVQQRLHRMCEAGLVRADLTLADPLLHWLPHLHDPSFPEPDLARVELSVR